MKKLLDKIKKFLNKTKKYHYPVAIGLLSILTIVIGTLAIGFVPAFLIVILIDAILIVGTLFSGKKKTKKSKKEKKEKAKKDKPNKETNNTKKSSKKDNVKKVKQKKKKSVFKVILIIIFILCIIGLLGIGAFFGYIIYTAPEFTEQNLYNKEATFLYDIDGEEFAKIGTEIRQKVKYEDLSESLIDAIIAAEDSRFFQHSGVDLPRFIKASISQVLGKGGGGASTLTMQVSKNSFTSTEDEGIKGIIRKFSDIYMSVFKIETHYTKEQIIEFYVNSNYLGGGAHGVEQASLNYFGKSAKDLNIAESAMIAGLFQAPVGYDPFMHPEECEERRQTILYLMLRHGYINQIEYDIAKELSVDKLLVTDKVEDDAAEYQDFINTVVSEIEDRYGVNPYDTPMKIYTTMNRKMQDNMNNVMDGVTYKWKDDQIQSGSVVLDVNTGAIVAVGGGRNTVARGDNYAVDIKRQIGSTAKPLYDYGPAIEYNNWSTYTPYADEPYKYSSGTEIYNFERNYLNFITMQEALRQSRNIPALKTFKGVKNANIYDFVTKLGLSPEIEKDENGNVKDKFVHEAHALGGYNGESPLTLAAAYAAISNGGYYIEPHSFTTVEFTESGEIYEVKPVKRKAMSAETSYMLAKMLEATSSYAVPVNVNGVNFAAKTGTTNLTPETKKLWGLPNNAISDKWIASFNDSYAITVWYGYKNLDSEYYLTSSDYSIRQVFQSIAKGVYTKKSNWKKPSGVIEATVEDGLPTAMLASPNTPEDLQVKAYFKKGFEPTETSTRFKQLNDVTNLKYDEVTNTLSWDLVEDPDFFDSEYLTKLYDPLFSSDKHLKEQVDSVLKYNEENVGKIVYDVYIKDSSGNLVFINQTDTNSYTYPIKETTTFVVKTNYSILKTTESKGSETTITKIPVVITSSINGESVVNLKINDTYIEPAKPVTVLENGLIDITSNCNIITTIIRNSDKLAIASTDLIDTSKVDSYTITYTITYNDYINSLTRTVNITE